MIDYILSIDPGDVDTAFCFIEKHTYAPIYFAKLKNKEAVDAIQNFISEHRSDFSYEVAIEMIASYGMAVGKTVFETCVWIGRFAQLLESNGCEVTFVYRGEVKMNICGQTRAKDTNVRVALIDRFAQHDFKTGKGTKKSPDFFYGFRADVWAAYAVGVTYLDANTNRKDRS